MNRITLILALMLAVGRLQYFAIVGFGMWGELDYRLFLLGDMDDGTRAPSTTRPQRLSAGVHVAF